MTACIILILILLVVIKIVSEFGISEESILLFFLFFAIGFTFILITFAISFRPSGDLIYEKIDTDRPIFTDSGLIYYYKENSKIQQSIELKYVIFNTDNENSAVFYSKEEPNSILFPNIISYNRKTLKEIRLDTSVKLLTVKKEK